jgi:hypothetical protein
LYRHVHSLHHKSYNPTAFSGTSMHPVESTLYYSASLMVVPFGVHPAIVLGCIIDCAVGAWLGHDGFQWPGSGDYFHQLHHAHFDCNCTFLHSPSPLCHGRFANILFVFSLQTGPPMSQWIVGLEHLLAQRTI